MTRTEKFIVVSTYLIFTMFSFLIIGAAQIFHWDFFPVAAVLAETAVSMSMLIIGKLSFRAYGWLLFVIGACDIWMYSLYSGSYYDVLIISSAFTTVLALYDSVTLMYMMTLSTILLLSYSIAVSGSVAIVTPEDILHVCSRTGCAVTLPVILALFINMKNMSDEKMRRSIEQAQRAERAKSDFLANMSHEIRTPMNAIIGMCELILRDEHNLSESAADKCFSIRTSGRNLLAIINDVLDFSKIESGNMVLVEAPYDISAVVSDVINMASAGTNGKRLEIIADVDPCLPSGLIGDEIRIRQIITNLMSNAVKFTQSGMVLLKVTQRKTDYGINLKVTVTDTGIGITPDDLEKLFVSFQQVDTKKNRSVEGTGLGLAISKQFVRMMGGFINVKSEYGKGSEFSFVIPQKVSDPRPFVDMRIDKRLECACYVRLDKFPERSLAYAYRSMIENMASALGVDVKLFETLHSLKQAVSSENFTHYFIAKEEYFEDMSFFEDLSLRAEVILIQDRTKSAAPGGNIRCIYKPFFINSVISALKNETISENSSDITRISGSFSAPKARVLIVDDNEVNLSVSVGLMKPYRMQIYTAMSGRNAIAMLRSRDFHIVFMDHMMPEMDGVETTKIIRENPGIYYKRVPIIALTANAVGSAREMFLRAGFNDFLSKPVELSALDRILKKYIPADLIEKNSDDIAEHSSVKPLEKSIAENEWFCSADGLKYTGGNEDVYLDILKVYLKNGLFKIDEIQRLYENENWKNYIIEVHALKSSSKSIGADKLSKIAMEIENAGKEGRKDYINSEHGGLISGYRIVLASVDSYITAHGGKTQKICNEYTEISPEELSEKIKELIGALEDFDSDKAMSCINGLDGYSRGGTPVSVMLKEVRSFAEDFEYAKAAETAAALNVYGVKGGA